MLWGITQETVQEWLGVDPSATGKTLKGVAASAGKVTGKARVITEPSQLYEIDQGDILVLPGDGPELGASLYADLGSDLRCRRDEAHTAIISREYGASRVVGNGLCDIYHPNRRYHRS